MYRLINVIGLVTVALALLNIYIVVTNPGPHTISPDVVRAALLERPEIIVEVAEALQAKQEQAEREASSALVEAHREALFDAPGPVLGNPDGSRVVVAFLDYQCGYCRAAQPLLKEAVAADGDLKIILRELPILGPESDAAARAAVAAGLQHLYLPMHEALLAQPLPLDADKILAAARVAGVDVERMVQDMESEEVKATIRASADLAHALDLSGTPSFAAPGAGILRGFGDLDRFNDFLDGAVAP